MTIRASGIRKYRIPHAGIQVEYTLNKTTGRIQLPTAVTLSDNNYGDTLPKVRSEDIWAKLKIGKTLRSGEGFIRIEQQIRAVTEVAIRLSLKVNYSASGCEAGCVKFIYSIRAKHRILGKGRVYGVIYDAQLKEIGRGHRNLTSIKAEGRPTDTFLAKTDCIPFDRSKLVEEFPGPRPWFKGNTTNIPVNVDDDGIGLGDPTNAIDYTPNVN